MAGWPERLGEVLAAAEPHRVVLIGARAARLAGEAAGRLVGEEAVSRFDSLAACTAAPFEARVADVALLTLDAAPDEATGGRDGDEGSDGDGGRDGGRGGGRGGNRSGGEIGGGIDRALGTACRLYPARLLLLVEADAPGGQPAPETLFAFGFRRLLVRPDGALHEYRLRDYKLPPDWLNARFWANPERFALDGEEGEDLDDTDAEEDDEEDDED